MTLTFTMMAATTATTSVFVVAKVVVVGGGSIQFDSEWHQMLDMFIILCDIFEK